MGIRKKLPLLRSRGARPCHSHTAMKYDEMLEILCNLKKNVHIIYDYTAFELGIIKIIKLKWCIKIL